MKKWLRAQPDQPPTITDLQTLIDRFTAAYNHHRPHRSMPHRATPAAVYNHLPKALPATSREADTHTRTHVILLIDDLHVRVITATTGELLRELTIDPSRDYQPQNKNPPTP